MCVCIYISAGNPTLTEETRRIFELTSFSKAKALTNVAIKIQPRAYGRFLAREPIRYLAERQPREREAMERLWCGRVVRGRSYICRENSRFQRGYCETLENEVNLEKGPLTRVWFSRWNCFRRRWIFLILAEYDIILVNFSNCIDFVIQ